MPVSAETLRLLMDAGVEGDELLRIVESIDRMPTKERSANAERQARHRAKKAAASVTNDVTSNVTEGVTPRAHVETNLKPNNQDKQKKKTARELQAEFEAELLTILDAERVSALVDVRKAKGGKLSANAARLLIAKIQTCGLSPAEAADTMALRNWISIEADWIKRDKPASTSPPNRQRTYADVAMDRTKANGTAGIFGNNGDVELIPPGRRESRPDDGNVRGGIGLRIVGSDH